MNALEIKNLTKSYKDFTLDHVGFSLPSGCIMGLVGENGAGKSTIIKLIMGAIKRSEGEIFVLGKDNRQDFKVTKEEIGVVLDEPGFPECITAKELNGVMKMLYKNLDEAVYFSYLKKLSIPADKEFKDFSRGMKMKLSIAAALSHHAKLLILDEATSGLDPIVRDNVLDILLDFTRDEDHSVLMSSHIVSDLEKICDYIAFLHEGKLIFCEEKDSLLEKYGMVRCTKDMLSELDRDAVKGKRENKYGVEALVDRERIPQGMKAERVTIEDIVLFMVKGAAEG